MKQAYYSFNHYLKETFGCPVWRVTLEAGFDCPNRDGKRAFGGCTFCTADGSSSRAQDPADSLELQLQKGIAKQRRRFGAEKFIAYLQSFTSTYGSVEHLKSIYDRVTAHPDVVMLSLGTRPDCLEPDVLELIAEYSEKLEVWLDLGLQSADNQILEKINRAHTAEEFFESVDRAKRIAPKVKICAHLIAGLPGEDGDPELKASRASLLALAAAPIDGIKIHNLCVLAGTAIARDFARGEILPLELDHYLDFLRFAIAHLPPHIVIHRLMGEAPTVEELLAPSWAAKKDFFLSSLRQSLQEANIEQGCALKTHV